jgi:alkyl sulfatase BDS1-like metallo-beta-lactamase superfamily hydrolase
MSEDQVEIHVMAPEGSTEQTVIESVNAINAMLHRLIWAMVCVNVTLACLGITLGVGLFFLTRAVDQLALATISH